MDIQWEKNPFRTPGLEEALKETAKKYHMTIEEHRQADAKLKLALCRERMRALVGLLGKPHWRDEYDGTSQIQKDFYAVNFIRAFPEIEDASGREYLHRHVYPLLKNDDLDHLIVNLHNERWRQQLNEMREDYIAWKARRHDPVLMPHFFPPSVRPSQKMGKSSSVMTLAERKFVEEGKRKMKQ